MKIDDGSIFSDLVKQQTTTNEGLSRELQFDDSKISGTKTKEVTERDVAKTPKVQLQEIFEDQPQHDKGLTEQSSIGNQQTITPKMASMMETDSKDDETGQIRPVSPIKSNLIETNLGSHCSSQKIDGKASGLKV